MATPEAQVQALVQEMVALRQEMATQRQEQQQELARVQHRPPWQHMGTCRLSPRPSKRWDKHHPPLKMYFRGGEVGEKKYIYRSPRI